MQTQRLGSRQLFNMLRNNLEKRIIKFYNETRDASAVVEYAVAVLVRHCISSDDFSFICRELIRELFLTATPNHTLRRFSVFFENYFTPNEWKTVIARLYRHKKEYRSVTEEARLYKEYLKEKDTTRTDELANHQFVIRSVFKGANERKHTWTLKNGHPTKTREELAGAVKILTLLSIFETSGVRKFTEFVDVYRDAWIADFPCEEDQKEPVEKNKAEKKASHKEDKKQKKVTPIENYKEPKKIPVKELSDGQLAKVSLSGKEALKKEEPKQPVLETLAKKAKTLEQSQPANKSNRSGVGNVMSDKIDIGKIEEQIKAEQSNMGFRKRVAQFLGRGS